MMKLLKVFTAFILMGIIIVESKEISTLKDLENEETILRDTCKDKSETRCQAIKKRFGEDRFTIKCQSNAFVKKNCKKTCDSCGGTGEGNSGNNNGCKEGVKVNLPKGFQECNEKTKGHCECATACGFKTYVFTVENEKRCLSVYRPVRLTQKLPIVIRSHCYGKDKLSTLAMKTANADVNQAAARYGFARMGISSPLGNWRFGNNHIVNKNNPMPCSAKDTPDMVYVDRIFEFIDANDDIFRTDRVYTEGFSQNAAFSAYIGHCHSDRVTGIWQGGSGMAMKEDKHIRLPAMQSKCSKSAYKLHGRDCVTEDPCTDCEFWPIYPCYQPKKPMIHCVADYNNDRLASADPPGDPETEANVLNMYYAAKREGHDVRMLRFKASDDKSIPGKHKAPRNLIYWQVGCWGMTPKCSLQCEKSFIDCIDKKEPPTAMDRTKAFAGCIKGEDFAKLPGCDSTCSPTFKMLQQSEMPYKTAFAYGDFDSKMIGNQPRPTGSRCSAPDFQ